MIYLWFECDFVRSYQKWVRLPQASKFHPFARRLANTYVVWIGYLYGTTKHTPSIHHLHQLHGYCNAYTAICETDPSQNPVWAFQRYESPRFIEFVSLFDQEAPDTVLKDFFRESSNEMDSLEIKTAHLLLTLLKLPSESIERDPPTWMFLRRGPAFPDQKLET